jgi:hypothetical protein
LYLGSCIRPAQAPGPTLEMSGYNFFENALVWCVFKMHLHRD